MKPENSLPHSQQPATCPCPQPDDIFINCNWVVTRWQYTFTHKQYTEQHNRTTNVEECGPCPVFASFTLAFAIQLRKKHGKTSVRLRKPSIRVQYTYYQNTHILQNPHKQSQSVSQSTYSGPISARSILILFSHLRLRIPSGICLSGFGNSPIRR